MKDIAASRRFYEDLLGQKVLFDFGENVSFEKGFFMHPDRHVIEIGEPMSVVIQRFLEQGMSEEKAAQRSSMPLEIVQQIAKSMKNI